MINRFPKQKTRKNHKSPVKRTKTEREELPPLLQIQHVISRMMTNHQFSPSHRLLLKPPPGQRVFNRLNQNLYRAGICISILCSAGSFSPRFYQSGNFSTLLCRSRFTSHSGFSDLPVTGSYRCTAELDILEFDPPLYDTEYS